MFKYDKVHKRIAGDLIAYVDDLRTLGYLLEEAWWIARQVMPRLQYFRMQDVGQKRRIGDGPWAGGVYTTSHGKIQKTVARRLFLLKENIFVTFGHARRVQKTYEQNYIVKISTLN